MKIMIFKIVELRISKHDIAINDDNYYSDINNNK